MNRLCCALFITTLYNFNLLVLAEFSPCCGVKAISDTLKQIGPSTVVNFTRPNKGLIILLLY